MAISGSTKKIGHRDRREVEADEEYVVEHYHLHTHIHEAEEMDPHNVQGDEEPSGGLPTEQELIAMEAPFNVPNGPLHYHTHYHSHRCPIHPVNQLPFVEYTVATQPQQPPHVSIVQQNGVLLPVQRIADLPQLVQRHPLSGFLQFQIEADRYIVSILLYEQQPFDGDEDQQVQEQGDIQVNGNEVAVEEGNGNPQDAN